LENLAYSNILYSSGYLKQLKTKQNTLEDEGLKEIKEAEHSKRLSSYVMMVDCSKNLRRIIKDYNKLELNPMRDLQDVDNLNKQFLKDL
jgi:hypothetical protein